MNDLVISDQSDERFLMKCIMVRWIIGINVVVKAKKRDGRARVYGADWRVVRGYPIALKAWPTVALNVSGVACTRCELRWE